MDISEFHFESIVAEGDGAGYVHIFVHTAKGIATGQLNVGAARGLAIDLLGAADAAFTDAAIYRAVYAAMIDEPAQKVRETVAGIIAAVRAARADDDDPDGEEG